MKHIVIVLLLAGCTTSIPESNPVEIRTIEVRPPAPIMPKPDQLNMRDVEFDVITIHNVEEKLAQSPVYYGLDQQNYKNLSLNTNDLRAHVRQQQTIIWAYEDYFKP